MSVTSFKKETKKIKHDIHEDYYAICSINFKEITSQFRELYGKWKHFRVNQHTNSTPKFNPYDDDDYFGFPDIYSIASDFSMYHHANSK